MVYCANKSQPYRYELIGTSARCDVPTQRRGGRGRAVGRTSAHITRLKPVAGFATCAPALQNSARKTVMVCVVQDHKSEENGGF